VPDHLPLIAWSRQELIQKRWEHQRWLDAIDKESERRGERDEKQYGFPVPIRHAPGVIGTGYTHYPTIAQAYAEALKQMPELHDAAPYRVHPVYLGKDDDQT
jgi:hypothetical protein